MCTSYLSLKSKNSYQSPRGWESGESLRPSSESEISPLDRMLPPRDFSERRGGCLVTNPSKSESRKYSYYKHLLKNMQLKINARTWTKNIPNTQWIWHILSYICGWFLCIIYHTFACLASRNTKKHPAISAVPGQHCLSDDDDDDDDDDVGSEDGNYTTPLSSTYIWMVGLVYTI